MNKQKESIDRGEISDGYHTFNELYYYRMLYNAAFFNLLPKEWVHKSKRHHNGEECFGGGWFIVMANLPTGQISNHYELKDWDLFQIPDKEIADEWDGHTPQEAAERLYKYLQEKQKEQKPAEWSEENKREFCKDNCKGYQETGRCFSDGDCKAKQEADLLAAKKYADEQLLGHNRELAESGHTRHFKMGYVCFAGYEIEQAYADGMLAERERLIKEIQKNTIEDGYIARDERGRLVYSNRKLEREWDPERSDGGWYPDDDIEGFDGMLSLPDKWFPEVRWADLPTRVKLIILKGDEK